MLPAQHQLLLQNLFNILHACLCKGPSVDDNKGPLAATVHAAGAAQNHLVIKVILLQVIPDNLHHLPVTS